ncbi:MAG: hypothetical protein AABY00_03475 [Nanoarchaeota archaeon]
MRKQHAITEMFRYCYGETDLRGFPPSSYLNLVCRTLGKEELLREHRRTDHKGTAIVLPSFPLAYVGERQQFFDRVDTYPEIHRCIFDGLFPTPDHRKYSNERFIDFCKQVYETIEEAREAMQPLKHLPEARTVLKTIDRFERRLGTYSHSLDALENFDMFLVDSRTGSLQGVRKDSRGKENVYLGRGCDLHPIVVRMKKKALEMIEQGKKNFREDIFNFSKGEFGLVKRGNLRSRFEQVAVPVRLHVAYRRFLDAYERQSKDNDEDREDDERFYDSRLPYSTIAHPRFAQFAEHYRILNMFPLSLSRSDQCPDRFVPIDFVTRRGEKKFLVVGLHSGGKSFFLENLVLASIGGQQLGERIPADELVLPRYERIIYYRNQESSSNTEGKAVTEVKEIGSIIPQLRKDDLFVADEFLDSARQGIETWLGPQMLDKLYESRATVFVCTHRAFNYRRLQRQGWTLLTPEHTICDGKVFPLRKLKRGIPNERINNRYVRERCEEIFI